jgi:hypothetical protein
MVIFVDYIYIYIYITSKKKLILFYWQFCPPKTGNHSPILVCSNVDQLWCFRLHPHDPIINFFCKCSNRRIWFANPNTSQTWKKEHYLDPMFFREFFYVAKVAILYRELLKIWQSSLGNFWQNLAKKPDMKHKSWIILLHFFATYWKPNVKTKCIFTFLLTFWQLKLKKIIPLSKFKF